jgi:hypothetical protein
MRSSESSEASDSTISTPSWVPATTRSSALSFLGVEHGGVEHQYSPSISPTRAPPIGPMKGAPESVSAAEAPIIATNVGIVLEIVG